MNTNSFSILPLSKPMLHNLNELGFTEMTPVQAESLPLILKNKDVTVEAKTGSGKTVAFGIGALNKLNVKKIRVQSLVLCPTRELADQVAKELRQLARAVPNVKILTLCGGVAVGPQLGSLRHQPHIIVGTPGRVLKHLDKGSLSLNDLELLILDEADRMLDMGFIDDIKRIISSSPKRRQTLLFSATYPEEIGSLSASIQKKVVSIQTTSSEVANEITEYFYESKPNDKLSALNKILCHYEPKNVIVFTNMKSQTQEISNYLRRNGVDALEIHGDLEQYQRNDVLVQFSNDSCSVLVATDVAARGLDIKDLAMVVNYDLPHDEVTYTHRIGRTGRAGETGVAVTLYSSRDAHKLSDYQNDIRIFKKVSELSEGNDFRMVPPNITLVIEGGKKDKIRPGDILGALTGEPGILGKLVGKIAVYDRQSYVAIERSMIEEAHALIQNGKIKGRKFSAWILK
jgi:ATP-independent RNA helicase DbpA